MRAESGKWGGPRAKSRGEPLYFNAAPVSRENAPAHLQRPWSQARYYRRKGAGHWQSQREKRTDFNGAGEGAKRPHSATFGRSPESLDDENQRIKTSSCSEQMEFDFALDNGQPKSSFEFWPRLASVRAVFLTGQECTDLRWRPAPNDPKLRRSAQEEGFMDTPEQVGDGADETELIRELFSIYRDIVRACGGPSGSDTRDKRSSDFAHRLESDQTKVRKVRSHAERLIAFYGRNGENILRTIQESGGIRLITHNPRDFDVSVIGAMSLFADTQIIADPVMHRVMEYSLEIPWIVSDAVALAQEMLLLRPFVQADLDIPPLLIYDDPSRREAERLNEPFSTAIEAWGEDTDTPWHRVHQKCISMFSKEMHTPPEIRAIMTGGIIQQVQEHLRLCDALRAEPLMFHPFISWIYRAYSNELASDLRQYGYLSQEAALALRAIQQTKFRWLQNVPLSHIPKILESQENRMFRERLEAEVKLIQHCSLGDIGEATIHVTTALKSMVGEHRKTMRQITDKFKSKNVSVRDKSALGVLIVGGVSAFSPALGHPLDSAAGLVLGGATALGVVGSAAANWFSNKREESVERQIARRSLFGVLASAARER